MVDANKHCDNITVDSNDKTDKTQISILKSEWLFYKLFLL